VLVVASVFIACSVVQCCVCVVLWHTVLLLVGTALLRELYYYCFHHSCLASSVASIPRSDLRMPTVLESVGNLITAARSEAHCHGMLR
jgi:hypothetical protein